jgi:hypothetical protein
MVGLRRHHGRAAGLAPGQAPEKNLTMTTGTGLHGAIPRVSDDV